jgi:uncharacterized integral membrane protein (TIGR00698 family)
VVDNGNTEAADSATKRQAWHPLHWVASSRVLLPGILVCGVIGLASTFLSEHFGGPQLLYALLIGLAFHFIHTNTQAKPGIEFCGRTILRLGVALLGVRITIDQVSQLGLEVAVVILLALLLTIFMGVWLASLLGRTREEGILSGGSVAICGASAALAISAVLPQSKANERFTLLAVISVTVLSTVAMVLYPMLIQVLDLAAVPAGVFLGGTIHDVAQVVAAGMMISPEAGDTATVVKLFRVMLLMPVVLVISLIYRSHQSVDGKKPKVPLIPGFLMVFVVMMLLASSGLVPNMVVQGATEASRACLMLAIAAAGIKTSIVEILQMGWKPLILFVGETLFIGLFVLLAVMGLGLVATN